MEPAVVKSTVPAVYSQLPAVEMMLDAVRVPPVLLMITFGNTPPPRVLLPVKVWFADPSITINPVPLAPVMGFVIDIFPRALMLDVFNVACDVIPPQVRSPLTVTLEPLAML